MKTTYLPLIPSSFCAFSKDCEISDFADRDITVHFCGLLCLLNHETQALFWYASTLIESLCDAVISGCSKFPVYLLPLDQKLNGPFWVCSEESSAKLLGRLQIEPSSHRQTIRFWQR